MKERRRCIRKIERAIEKLQELTGLGSVLDGCDGTEIEMNKVQGFIGDRRGYRGVASGVVMFEKTALI